MERCEKCKRYARCIVFLYSVPVLYGALAAVGGIAQW